VTNLNRDRFYQSRSARDRAARVSRARRRMTELERAALELFLEAFGEDEVVVGITVPHFKEGR
jgi:hypothetical protein